MVCLAQDLRHELGGWMSSVEQVLIDRGLLAPDGTMTFLSREVENALDGFIEDPSELSTLLQMGRTAQRRQAVPRLLVRRTFACEGGASRFVTAIRFK